MRCLCRASTGNLYSRDVKQEKKIPHTPFVKGGEKRIFSLNILLSFILLFCSSLSFAKAKHSLSTEFSDVVLSGMAPGMLYSFKKEKRFPYKVINRTDEAEDVEVTVEKPTPSQMKEGYEPVPDVTWVKVFPVSFHLEPGEGTDCDVIISIPDDEKFANRHFQAMIVTKTVGHPDVRGIALTFALASRIRFSTGPSPEAVVAQYRQKIFEALKIDLTPMSLFLSDVPVGEKVKLDGEVFSTIQLINRGKEDYRLVFTLAADPKIYGLTGDYEPSPTEVKIKFAKKKMKVKKRSINDVFMEVEIPGRDDFYGRQFAFVVKAEVLGFDVPVNLFSRVYLTTEEKKE
ncbi:MAG: hypothetical protein ABIJ15_06375 [bacterium]